MPESPDYASIPKTTTKAYRAAQSFVAVSCRELEFTNEEIKDVLSALGLAER